MQPVTENSNYQKGASMDFAKTGVGFSNKHFKFGNGLLNQKVVATDATVVTVNGKQNYIRNFSIKTAWYTMPWAANP